MILTVNNDFQNHSFDRRGDPDFPLRALNLFPTNDADQRGSQGIQEAGQLSSLDISVPHCVCCSLRRRQVGLDVVVVTLNASAPPEDGMVQKIDLQHMSARRLGAAWRASY